MCEHTPSPRHPGKPAVPSDAVTESAHVSHISSMKPLEAIRCTQPTCSCECFAPGKKSLRYCDTCSHGWVSHALDKLGTSHIMNLGLQVEVVQPNIVFDIASLMLYGAHATPVRLKILLDRLFSVLQHEEVLQVLHGFGWTYEDYARGYILQDSSGRVLDKWCVATREEEMVVLQQFLRFGETKAIAQEIILQDTKDRHDVLVKQTSRAESDIKKFIERSNLTMQNYIKSYESTRQLFGPRSVPVPFIPPPSQVPRMMTPPLVSPSGFSVSPTGRETGHITPTSSRAHVPVVSTPTTLPAPTPSTQHSQPTQQPFDARKDHQLPNPATAALSLSPGLILPKAMAAAAVAAAQQRPPVAAENSPKNLSVRLPVVVPSASRASPSAQIIQQQSQTQAQQIQQLQLLQQQQLQQQQQQQLQQQQKQQQQQQQQQQSQQHQKLKTQIEQDIDEVDGGDGFGSCSDDEGEVIDYSTKDGGPESPSDGEKSNKQHNRKSSNPTKRQWTPSASFGSTLVGPNGKKRVLCTACNKTFCDKGALKIHYSAVHLKEMHKCTVEGCNMMFSSRRSRNRHSANPNPKLHMPQKRKDEMDQGDGTEMDLSTVSNNSDDISTPAPCATSTPTLPLPPSTSSGTPITAVNTVAGLPILDAPRLIRPDASFFLEMSAQFPFMSPPPTKRVKLDEEDKPTDLSKGTFPPATLVVSSEEGPCDLSSKKSGSEERKLEIDLDAPIDKEDKQPKKDRKETVMTGSAALAPAVIATVAAIAEESAAKSENGNRVGNRRKNNAPTRCAQKNESLSTSEENIDEKDISLQEELHISLEPVQDCDDVCQVDEAIKDNSEEAEAKSFPKTASLSSVNETNVELQNGAAAESLEKVGDVEKTDEKDFPCEQNDIVMLKEAQSSNTESEAKHKENDADDEGDGSDSDSDDDDDEAFSTADVNGLTGSQDYPPELYVDKDYPLTCKICGKVFQNSFTVKVHFQNVHLKLMHACTVNGCAATFPSKRSRDRHSANLNLHRKQVPGDAQVPEEMDDALRGNILARLYGMDYMGGGGSTGPNLIKNGNVSLPVPTNTSIVIQGDVVSGNNNNNNNNMTNNNNNEDEDQGIDKSKSVSQPDNTMSQAGRNGKVSKFPGSPTPLKLTIQPAGLNGHVSKPGSAGSEAVSDNSEDGDEQVDGKTGNLSNDDAALASPSITCQVCGSSFSNLLVLREHVGLAHPDHSDLDIDTEAVATRRSLSPRRARSRQRASRTVGLTTRKNSSSAS